MIAYWVDEIALENHLDCSIETLIAEGVCTDMETPTAQERRLLVHMRTGTPEQREKAIAALCRYYDSKKNK